MSMRGPKMTLGRISSRILRELCWMRGVMSQRQTSLSTLRN